jgi:hypothetical protein
MEFSEGTDLAEHRAPLKSLMMTFRAYRTDIGIQLRRTAAHLRDEETVGKSLSSDDHQFGVLEPDRTERWIFGPITFVQTLQTSD